MQIIELLTFPVSIPLPFDPYHSERTTLPFPGLCESFIKHKINTAHKFVNHPLRTQYIQRLHYSSTRVVTRVPINMGDKIVGYFINRTNQRGCSLDACNSPSNNPTTSITTAVSSTTYTFECIPSATSTSASVSHLRAIIRSRWRSSVTNYV